MDSRRNLEKFSCHIKFLTLAAVVVACGLAGSSAWAQEAAAPAKNAKGVCIQASRIRSTKVIDQSTILFYMNGKKIWKNTLTVPCRTITSQDGFVYEPKVDRLCSNLERIRVIRTGQICLLGAFTPYTEATAAGTPSAK